MDAPLINTQSNMEGSSHSIAFKTDSSQPLTPPICTPLTSSTNSLSLGHEQILSHQLTTSAPSPDFHNEVRNDMVDNNDDIDQEI